ncbi:MAG TPA: succinylglutamate desuccinylase/aspartoacylase family protein [Methylomirabilota bacterium]|nr:succinylglutamate desuccinylase/aspartoacylase family protein [Methylomirabilota bacterium]
MTQDPVRIRDVVVERGAKRHSFLKVGETGAGPIEMPVVVVHGRRPGPTLCLTGGVHATEYPGQTAVREMARQLDPATLAGTVIAIPVVNMPMFAARSAFVSPIDGLNLNRVAPGRPDGTITELIAHTLFSEILSLATHHIDCHGGDLTEILWPYAAYRMTGKPELDETGEAMARCYSPRIVALFREGTALVPAGTVTTEAARRGVASILGECGSAGGLDPADVSTHVHGITNVMRFLRMLPGEPVVPAGQVLGASQFVVQARRGGLLRLSVGIGETVSEGQELGEVWDAFGDVVETLRAPARGLVRIIWTHKVVTSGDAVLKCWVTEPAPPFAPTDRFVR